MNSIVRAPVQAQSHAAPGAAAAAKAVVAGAQKRVLYIDDDEPLLWLMTHFLERRGYRVRGYAKASDALAAVRANPLDFDLAITDYSMPGMSGLEVAAALRAIRADLPVALISAYMTDEVRARAPAAGVSEIIQKSDTLDEMCDAVVRMAHPGLEP
jgi:CheY-like chemotaxis protein